MEKCCIYIYHKNFSLKPYEIQAFSKCFEKYGIYYILISERFQNREKRLSEKLKKHGIILYEYSQGSDYLPLIEKIKKYCTILYVDSLHEELVEDSYKLKKKLHIPVSKKVEIFTDKQMQRKILNTSPHLQVKSTLFTKKEITFEVLQKHFSLPCVIKPIKGVESSGTYMIRSKKDVNSFLQQDTSHSSYSIDTYLGEEYIDGDFYSIDYFVDETQAFFSTPPIYVKTAQDIEINDFLGLSRFTGIKLLNESKLQKLQQFIKETIQVCDIKNTFIHHEFKHVGNGKFKTIEINGRIGGRRIHMLQESYNINLLSLFLDKKDYICESLSHHMCCIAIYPKQTGVFKDYNKELFDYIKELSSFHSLDFRPSKYVGNKVGLSREYYWNLGNIYLKHDSKEQLLQDYRFIEENYKKLIILKT